MEELNQQSENNNYTYDYADNLIIENDAEGFSSPKKRSYGKFWIALILISAIAGSWWVSNLPDKAQTKQKRAQQFTNVKQLAQQKAQQREESQQKAIERIEVSNNSSDSDDATLEKAQIPAETDLKTPPTISNQEVAQTEQMRNDYQQLQQSYDKLDSDYKQLEQAYSSLQKEAALKQNLMQYYMLLLQKITDGKAFAYELKKMQKLDGLSLDIADKLKLLKQYAKTKIKDYQGLQSELNQAVAQYYADNPLLGKTDDSYLNLIGNLVQVKKIGTSHAGTDDSSLIAKIEYFAQNNQLKSALNLSQNLSVEASPYFKDWRSSAYAQFEVKRIMGEFKQIIFEKTRGAK